jgi:drug/metabolite transporter (DMT)-like permease
MNYIGEVAGVATAFFFALTALIFTSTGRSVGSQVTNRVRLIFALLYLVLLNIVFFHEPLPFSAGASRWMWLGLSGIIGLALGDAFLFQSFVALGARIGTLLLLGLAPIFGSIMAWVFFDERLSVLQIVGMVVALAGIAWVVISNNEPSDTHGHAQRGILFGILAALGQAVGLVLSRQGMIGDFPIFQANAIRMVAGTLGIWLWTAIDGQMGSTFQELRAKPRVIGLLALGAFVGPVLGVSASLLAIQHAEIGVASTLMALTPVILLPVSHFVFKERIGWQGLVGTVLAILGVAVLFLA